MSRPAEAQAPPSMPQRQVPARVQKLPEPVEAFLDELAQQRRLSPHTVTAYRRDLAELSRLSSATALPHLHAADVRRALARLHGQGLAPTSLARKLSAWRRLDRKSVV